MKGTDQQREEISVTDGNTRAGVICYNCQHCVYICLFCPNGDNIQTFQITLNQSEVLSPISWVLLDLGSTVSSIFNAGLVDNIWDENVSTTVHNNGVSKYYTQTESLHLLPLGFHFNSTSLANNISLSEV